MSTGLVTPVMFGSQPLAGNSILLEFSGLAILISCFGLFGLAMYMTELRIKEIGIRKVVGATVVNITTLITKDFLKLVLIAFLISIPIAWWTMDKWLSAYNHRIQLDPQIFLYAGLLSISIAIITVGYQAIKAAIRNPVVCLRSE